MKGKIAGLFAGVLISVLSLFGAAACGGLQNEAENPVRQAAEQIVRSAESAAPGGGAPAATAAAGGRGAVAERLPG